ncbi:MAG: hypothetical protein VYC30_06510, partial [Pseudomonadota bacterium]|nr:hypothetical protein [Pseudomonadota bacterium]
TDPNIDRPSVSCSHSLDPSWFYAENGISDSLTELVEKFRNNAAHISELTKEDYVECEKLTLMENGILEKISKCTALR